MNRSQTAAVPEQAPSQARFVGDRRNWAVRAQYGDPLISLHDLDAKALCARTRVLRAQRQLERGLGEGPTLEQVREAEILTAQVAAIIATRNRLVH